MSVRNTLSKAGLLALSLSLSHCGKNENSAVKDLNPGPDSNIAAAGLAKTIQFSDIETLKITPNTMIPKGLIVSLIGEANGFNNWQFVTDLYREVHKINMDSALQATVGNPNPTEAELRNQEITLVVMVPQGAMSRYDRFVKNMELTLTLELGASFTGKLYLAGIENPLVLNPDTGKMQSGEDLWIQDFGEFAVAKLKGSSESVYTVVDTNRNKNRMVYDPKVFSDVFGIPLVKLGLDVDHSGQYGGNMESTPDGILYMGDSVDELSYGTATTPSPLFDQLKNLGNANAQKLNSNWLAVGHVDEFMSFIPSNGTCDSTMLYGSPLLGLKMMLEQATDQEFALFSDELATLPIGYSDDGKSDVEITLDVKLTRADLQNALAKFAKVSTTGSISTDIQDYDVSKASSAVTLVGSPQSAFDYKTMLGFLRNPTLFAEFYIWRNLMIETSILKNRDQLLAVESCKQSEVMPQVFLPNFFLYEYQNYGYWSKDSAHLPGMTNAIVLRDQVIFPDPWVQSMRDFTSNVMAKETGSADNAHFVDDTVYHFSLGEVHCATNVIREEKLKFQF